MFFIFSPFSILYFIFIFLNFSIHLSQLMYQSIYFFISLSTVSIHLPIWISFSHPSISPSFYPLIFQFLFSFFLSPTLSIHLSQSSYPLYLLVFFFLSIYHGSRFLKHFLRFLCLQPLLYHSPPLICFYCSGSCVYSLHYSIVRTSFNFPECFSFLFFI